MILKKFFHVSKEIIRSFKVFLAIYLLTFGLSTYFIGYLIDKYNYSLGMTTCISGVLLLLQAILFHWYFLKKDNGIYENTLSKMGNWFVLITLVIFITIIVLLFVTFLLSYFALRFGQNLDLLLSIFAIPAFLMDILKKFTGTYFLHLALGFSLLKVLTRDGRTFLLIVSVLIVIGFIGKILFAYLCT